MHSRTNMMDSSGMLVRSFNKFHIRPINPKRVAVVLIALVIIHALNLNDVLVALNRPQFEMVPI